MSITYGDSNSTLIGKQHGKNQILVESDNQDTLNTVIGDVDTITDHAKGGNDYLVAGNYMGSDVP